MILEVTVDQFSYETILPFYAKEPYWVSELKKGNTAVLETTEDKCDLIEAISDKAGYTNDNFDFQQNLACDHIKYKLKKNVEYIKCIEIENHISGHLLTQQISIEYQDCWEENICMLNDMLLFVFDCFCSQDVTGTYSSDEFIFVFKKLSGKNFSMIFEGFVEV